MGVDDCWFLRHGLCAPSQEAGGGLMVYWEERLTKDQLEEVSSAFSAHRQKPNLDQLYMELTDAGMTPEEADAFCQLD